MPTPSIIAGGASEVHFGPRFSLADWTVRIPPCRNGRDKDGHTAATRLAILCLHSGETFVSPLLSGCRSAPPHIRRHIHNETSIGLDDHGPLTSCFRATAERKAGAHA